MDKYDITKKDDQWKFRREGSDRSLKNFDRKEDAIEHARGYVRDHGGSLKIRKQDGTYQEERTYPRSEDPKKSPG